MTDYHSVTEDLSRWIAEVIKIDEWTPHKTLSLSMNKHSEIAEGSQTADKLFTLNCLA